MLRGFDELLPDVESVQQLPELYSMITWACLIESFSMYWMVVPAGALLDAGLEQFGGLSEEH
jgi:hypothetical protein